MSLIFCALGQISKIKIYHKDVIEHPRTIKGRWRLNEMDVLGPNEASVVGVADKYFNASDKEGEGGSVEAGDITYLNEAGGKYVEDTYQTVKSNFILPRMLKTHYFIKKCFKENRGGQEKLFKHVHKFGEQE